MKYNIVIVWRKTKACKISISKVHKESGDATFPECSFNRRYTIVEVLVAGTFHECRVNTCPGQEGDKKVAIR